MANKDITRLKSVIDYCQKIEEKINKYGNDIDDFIDNSEYRDLCSFYVLQIGEQTKKLISGDNKKLSGDKLEQVVL